MAGQLLWRGWQPKAAEIVVGCHHGHRSFAGQLEGHHVLGDVVDGAHTEVEAFGDHVHHVVVDDHLDVHVRVIAQKTPYGRIQKVPGRVFCAVDAQPAADGLAEVIQRIDAALDAVEHGRDVFEQLLPRLGGGHGPCRAVDQPDAQPFFQLGHAVAECRGLDVQHPGGPAVVTLPDDLGEGVEIVEIPVVSHAAGEGALQFPLGRVRDSFVPALATNESATRSSGHALWHAGWAVHLGRRCQQL